jgi:hypothetical protein
LTRSVYSTLTLCLAHFADLQQWVDQDEQNEAPEDDYTNNFGGGMGEDGGFGGIDFSKLGGGAAAGGEGGMEGLGAGDDEEEEMPELEDEEGEGEEEEEAASTSKGKEKAAAPKIEEVS